MLKKGQRVQINSGGSYYGGLYDGRTAITSEEFDDEDGYHYGLVILDIGFAGKLEEYNLTPVKPSIDNLMVGDVVGDERWNYIIQFIGNDNVISMFNEKTGTHLWVSKKEMIMQGLKVISPSLSKSILKTVKIGTGDTQEEFTYEDIVDNGDGTSTIRGMKPVSKFNIDDVNIEIK